MSAITAKASRKMKKYAVLTREPRCFLGSFDFSWEQRKLSEMCGTFEYGLNAAAKEFDGKNKYIRITDIDDASREFLLSDLSSPDICLDGMSKYLLSSGDIVFARTGASVGKTYIYRENDGIVYFAGFLIRAKVNQDNDAEFVFQSTLSPSYEKYIRITSQRSGQPGVNAQEYGEYDLFAPSKEEQQRIGQFLRGIDNLITLHQRKCALLFSSFQALISMMFTTSTFSWEQRKFEEIAVRSSVICSDDTLPRVEYEDIVSGTGRLNKDIYAKQSSKSGIVFHQGDVLYGKLRPYLQNWLLPTFDGLAVGDFWVLQPQNADSSFLYRLIQSRQFDEVANQSTGTKMPRADWKLMSKTVFSIPSNISEQAAIGTYFTALDNLITLHQRKCISFTGRAGRLISTVNKKRITSSWEQRKFGEVFDCTVPNNTLSRAELSYDEGTVLNVHYGDVLIKYDSVLDVQKDDIPRIPHRCREDFNGALLQDGDVIIADTAEDETTGKACEIGNLQGSAIVSGLHTMVCRPRNRMALGYLGYYLNSNAYHHQLLPLMQGIKVLSLSRSNIQKTSVSYPSAMKEQQLIASYFSQLDNLITLHQRKPFLMKWRTSDANRNQTNRLVL